MTISFSDSIDFRRDNLEKVPPRIRNVEAAVLDTAFSASKKFQSENYNYLKWEMDGIHTVKPKFEMPTVGITFFNQGRILLGLSKNRTFTTLSGKIEDVDFQNLDIPVSLAAAVRIGSEGRREVLPRRVLSEVILRKSTPMLSGAGKDFEMGSLTQAVFVIRLSENAQTVVDKLNRVAQKALENNLNHEMTEYAWIDLSKMTDKEARIDDAVRRMFANSQKHLESELKKQ